MPLAMPLLAPTHGLGMRFVALLALCGAGAVLFAALVLALGVVDREALRNQLRRKSPAAAIEPGPLPASKRV